MSIQASGWQGFDNLAEKVEGGWLYRCDGLPWPTGCGNSVVVTRRWSRVGTKKSGWLVCYGLEPKPEFGDAAPFNDPDQWQDDHDVVLTFCPSCALVVLGQSSAE